MIGRLAGMSNTGDFGSSHVRAPEVSTVVDGLQRALGAERVVVEPVGRSDEAARRARARSELAVVVVGYTARDEGEYVDDGNRRLIDLRVPAR